MEVYIRNVRDTGNLSGRWYYLGKSFLALHKLERTSASPRRPLELRLENAKEMMLPTFLGWLEAKRLANNDSLDWWMSYLAGRNTLICDFFLNLCYLHAFIAEIECLKGIAGSEHDRITVVCENSFLTKALKANLPKDVRVLQSPLRLIWFSLDLSRGLLRAAFLFLKEIRWCILNKIAAVRTKADLDGSMFSPRNEGFVVLQCLDDKAFQDSNGPIKDRYLTIVPQWLESRGKLVIRLPWLFNITMPLYDVFRRLRQDRCLIIWDFLGLADIWRAFFDHFCSFLTFYKKVTVSFPGVAKIDSLLLKEALLQLATFPTVRHRLMIQPLVRATQQITRLAAISTFELNQPEFAIVDAIRKKGSNCRVVGFYHAIVTKDYLAYHVAGNEWGSPFFPDLVVTNGPKGKEILESLGAPKNRIRIGPGLRQKKVAVTEISKKDSLDICVLLSMDLETTAEMVYLLNALADFIRVDLRAKVRLKPHPMVRQDQLMSTLGLEALPEGWVWESGEIHSVLEKCYCALAMNTASVHDAVLCGMPIVVIKRSLDFTNNYLDAFEQSHPELKAIPKDEVRSRLQKLYFGDTIVTRLAAENARSALVQSVSDVEDKALETFIEGTNSL